MNKKEISQRLLSEFNDLKRTVKSISEEMNYPIEDIEKLTNGNFENNLYFNFLMDFSKHYPVDIGDLFLVDKNTKNGVLFFSAEDSKKSARIFSRKDKNGNFTPYYEYRDTAKSNVSYFYPEWIEELRVVENSDPYNKDVVYNHGHLLHQYNLFVGPVNYYYELDGKKYCIEMNTGDTSYISPFVKHSFTSRNKKEMAYIAAVTNGGLVKRNQKEFSSFGLSFLNKSLLPIESRKETIKLIISNAAKNELINFDDINKRLLKSNQTNKQLEDFYNFKDISTDDLIALCDIINISPGDIIISENIRKEDVIHKFFDEKEWQYYPSKENYHSRIYRCVNSKEKLLNLKGFILNIRRSKEPQFEDNFQFSLNLYIINFGSNEVILHWKHEDKFYKKVIKPFDSLSIDPYVEFVFTSENEDNRLFLATSDTGISHETKKELSFFKDAHKTITENKQWFKGKTDE
jgi:methylphosphonate synthase